MKTKTPIGLGILVTLLLFSLAPPARAVEFTEPTQWDFSWTLTGDLFVRGTVVPTRIEGTSLATLFPRPGIVDPAFPPNVYPHVYSLTFDHNGAQFGGLVASGVGWGFTTWQFPEFGGASVVGSFGINDTGNNFSLSVGTLSAHGPFLSGQGTREVSAAEPDLPLLLVAAAAVAVWWRCRRESNRTLYR